MKNNAPKRKVFQDAVDLISPVEEVATTVSNGYEMIPIEKIVPFHNHPFRLYEGERLNDMVENVREHGILTPVIVLKTDTGYEMLAGHNRMNAAKIVGIDEIPAIVKEGLTEKEAYVYVIETNMLQRSFSELSVSEKAAVLAERYDKVLSQGKRNDIINELTELDGTCGHGVHKSRDDIGEDYGMSGRSAARLMRVNHLVPELKEKVDSGELSFVAGVGLSYLSEEEQRLTLQNDSMPDAEQVKILRADAGSLTKEKVAAVVNAPQKVKSVSIKIPEIWREKYFVGMEKKQISDVIEAALELWVAREGDINV